MSNHAVMQADPAPTTQTVATPWTAHEGWLVRQIWVSREGMDRLMGDSDCVSAESDTEYIEYQGDMLVNKAGHETFVIWAYVWNPEKRMDYTVREMHSQFAYWQQAMEDGIG